MLKFEHNIVGIRQQLVALESKTCRPIDDGPFGILAKTRDLLEENISALKNLVKTSLKAQNKELDVLRELIISEISRTDER